MYSYLKNYEQLHTQDDEYGTSSIMYKEEVCLIIEYLKPTRVLDYGCGKGILLKYLAEKYPSIKFYGYDPAIKSKSILTEEKIDLVINTDVLEHIPEKILPEVVEKISSISSHVYFCLHHAAADGILPNGENAHCTIKPPEWYHELFKKYFECVIPLPGAQPHLTSVATFQMSSAVLKKYDKIIIVKKMIVKLICFFSPIYLPLRPFILPWVRKVKDTLLKI